MESSVHTDGGPIYLLTVYNAGVVFIACTRNVRLRRWKQRATWALDFGVKDVYRAQYRPQCVLQ